MVNFFIQRMKFLEQQASRSVCVCVLSSSSSSLFCVQNVCEKKGKKMCCVRAGTFEILHHLSLSLSLSFVSCNVPPSNHGRRITEHPTLPIHQKQNQKTQKKLHKKNHTINKSQTEPFSSSSGSIQFQEIFPKRCSNVT